MLVRLSAVLLAIAAVGCTSSGQHRYDSPQEAADALVAALRANDQTQISDIFGPGSEEVISSGDPIADRADAERFVEAYDVWHGFETDPQADRYTLIVGRNVWPFPVPIVASDGEYVFHTAAGKQELLDRRIGRNELSAEQVCLAIVDAQQEYVATRPMGGDLPLYARKVMSDPGTRNGLYWPTTEGQTPSPLGPLLAQAAEEGYVGSATPGEPAPPYHGYRYKLLTAQGPHATGGEADYEVGGSLIGGFGVVAYPAEYGRSGIMTFITNHEGIVYQRDLGADTEQAALAMTQFDPGPGWTRATDAGDVVAAGEE